MKLYDRPKCLADLVKGDVVYTIVNGEITQAKLIGFVKEYELEINEGLRMGDKSYYEFITPTGYQFKVTYQDLFDNKNKVFATYEDLRKDEDYNNLQWNYGYLNTYGRGDKENKDARNRFILAVRGKYGISFEGTYCFHIFFNSKKTKQVTKLNFPKLIEYDNTDDFYISHCGNKYGFLGDMLKSGKFFRTKEECEQAYKPKIVTFDEPKEELPKDHFIVYKRLFENQQWKDDELVGIFDKKTDAVATASMKGYDDACPIPNDLDEKYYCYIVFPCDKNGDGILDRQVFATPFYSVIEDL